MRTPLVILNLLHQRVRTVVAIAGVAFAVLLVFMQLGFYGSAATSATSLYSMLDYDLLLVSSNYLNVNRAHTFPASRLYQALDHEDVAAVAPLYVSGQTWRIKDSPHYRRSIIVVGFDLDEPVFKERVFSREPAAECLAALRAPDTVLMDTSTRAYFGKRRPGTETELAGHRVQVVGRVTIGTGYGGDGLVLTSDRTYARLYGSGSLEHVTLGLIRLKPAARPRAHEVKESLARHLYNAEPRDEVRVMTRAEAERGEQAYWMGRTSVGIIFQLGVAVALLVGIIFVYQVIATDIANHFAEYATLKAMGYSHGYLRKVVLGQALVLSVLGYLPALLVAFGLYALGQRLASIPLVMTWTRAVGVLALSVAMCSVSGILALQKVKSADPADLF
jgi:putative ABC transport system permease protein